MRVLIVVTHLLGSGHLSRALHLGRAFAVAGHEAHVVSGGFPVPHLDASGVTWHQLPALRADGTDFSRLLDPSGEVASEGYHAERQDQLLALLERVAPDVLITELFPFGRRNLRREFLSLLEAAKGCAAPPRICASIRDILAPPSKPAKSAFAQDMVARYYDAVLVHSDPDLIPLDASWPVTDALAGVLRYTGFVAAPVPEGHGSEGAGDILVSAGGGSVGQAVFDAAVDAAAHSPHRWRLLVGGHDRAARITDLTARASANVVVEPVRPDYREMLRHAAASVSLCGYNTAMDILQTGVPALVVPFDDGREVEQSLRAKALADRAGLHVLRAADLTGATLRNALDAVIAAGPCVGSGFRFEGAAETVRICEEMAQ